MPSLQIRNLPEDLYRALALRARRAQRSLAQQALVELRGNEAENPQSRRRQILATIKHSLVAHTGPVIPPPEELIREDRAR